MNQQTIFLRHSKFEEASKNDLELLINSAPNSISYAIADMNRGDILAIFNAQKQDDPLSLLESELRNRKELQQYFVKVHLRHSSANDLLIPSYLSENTHQQWMNNFVKPNAGHSLIPATPFASIVPVLEIPNRLEKILESAGFKSIEIHHPAEIYLKEDNNNTLFVELQGQSMYLVLCKNGQLIFQKQFEINNVDEFTYYLLFSKNQLQIERETKISLIGLMDAGDAFHEAISRYFKNIAFYEPEGVETKNTLQGKLPAHYFSNLTALSSCASLAEN